MHPALGKLTVGGGVELEKPWGVTEFGCNVLKRIHGEGGYAQRNSGTRGSARSSEITVAVCRAQPDHANRCHEDGGPTTPPEFNRHIAFGGADEHAGNQAPLLECGDVGLLGALIPRASGDVGPDRRRQRLLCAGLQLIEGHRQAGQYAT